MSFPFIMYEGGILLLIHRMTANFGKLQNQTLELKEGLNILHAPNETGKTTWCAFLLSMLYGINSRERERAGFIPDKIRYAPWTGVSMSGSLDCRINGEAYTLTRTTRRQTAPMAEFQAVYTGTGDSVPNLTGAACGETLLGVSREVFERSAFIRQTNLPITQDAGLERRIASLITSGEEDASYSEAAAALKQQLNRRRHNQTGQLPALEAQLREIEQQLAQAEGLSGQLASINLQTQSLCRQEDALSEELAQHDRWEIYLQAKTLQDAKGAADQAVQNAAQQRQRLETAHIPSADDITRLSSAIVHLTTIRKDAEQARAEQDSAAKALQWTETTLSESPFAGQTPETARQSAILPEVRPFAWWMPLLFAGIGAVCALAVTGFQNIWTAVVAAVLCAVPGGLLARQRVTRDKQKQAAHLSAYKAENQQELSQQLTAYIELYHTQEEAQAEFQKRTAVANSLYASLASSEKDILQEVQSFSPSVFDMATAAACLRECACYRSALMSAEAKAQTALTRYETLAQQPLAPLPSGKLAPPTRGRKAVLTELTQIRTSLSASRSAADRLTGQLHTLGEPALLSASAQQLRQQIAGLEEEYEALHLALSALDGANTVLQNSFSPALGNRTAEIFSQLTHQRYTGVVLDRAFRLSAEPAGGDSIYRSAALLSAGTADQLYLAARLAICELVLPKDAPLILDDALSNFDDDRCKAALAWLKQEAEHRQILLFSCHSREAEFFANDGEVSIQRLTETV